MLEFEEEEEKKTEEGETGRDLKVAASGGKKLSEIMRDTDRVIEKNLDKYVDNLKNDILGIQKLQDNYLKDPSPSTLKPLFDKVHNMRGQGTLFGYPLVTTIGGHFCRYIDGLPEGVMPREDALLQFTETLKIVQTEKMSGEGTEEMQMISTHLGLMVDKFIQ